ncbi:AAA family ATPase [Priestia megaterium]|uniref:AAA family ATPase n=1 Tax=Priestia megaterium TaxID=1404 RepID=UPI00298D42F3|nr:AAA family ATPase [Priestia megaterium]
MIYIKRRKTPKISKQLKIEKQSLKNYIEHFKEVDNSDDEYFYVLDNYKVKSIKNLDNNWYVKLRDQFSDKCAYCETPVYGFGHIDRFRPFNGVIDTNGDYSAEHYIWLAYEWENLYLVCNNCNVLKRNVFPVQGKRADLFSNIENEKSLLIDPCQENPAKHIHFKEDGFVKGKTRKGATTIKLLDLNRSSLIKEREDSLSKARYSFNAFVDSKISNYIYEIENILLKSPYLGIVKQFLVKWIDELQEDTKEFIFNDIEFMNLLKSLYGDFRTDSDFSNKINPYIEKGKNIKPPKSLYFKRNLIKSIEVHNFRGLNFTHSFNIEETAGAWLILLGENGSGKTSILQAIALALSADKKDRQSLKSFFSGEEGYIQIILADEQKPIGLGFKDNSIVIDSDATIPVIAYGAIRLLNDRVFLVNNENKNNIDNLFIKSQEDYFLPHPISWLKTEEEKRALSQVIIDILPSYEDNPLKIFFKNEELYLIREGSSKKISLNELSSGYKTIILLVSDIMRSIYNVYKSGNLAEGIVLIDEIDAHLHPTWKMRIVSRLRQAFPRMQFIVTSHDPLCLRGIHNGEIAVLQHNGDFINVINDLPDPAGLRIDQILTSEMFGMNSTIDPKYDKLIKDYHYQLSLPSNERTEEFEKLKEALEEFKYLGSTNRERILYQVIDEYISARKLKNQSYYKVDKSTQEKLVELWKNYGVEEI